MDLRRVIYIALTGYGPSSDFTLEDWLHAREIYRKNEKPVEKLLNLKPFTTND